MRVSRAAIALPWDAAMLRPLAEEARWPDRSPRALLAEDSDPVFAHVAHAPVPLLPAASGLGLYLGLPAKLRRQRPARHRGRSTIRVLATVRNVLEWRRHMLKPARNLGGLVLVVA